MTMGNVAKKELTILLAEDDPGHARLIEKNLRRSNVMNDIVHVTNGQDAVDYVYAQNQFADADHGGSLLILLDLNMPVMDGYQVLDKLKNDPQMKHIPIIVLTTTDDKQEIRMCYERGCNVYVTKPVEYGAFVEAIKSLNLFFTIVQVPST